MNYNTKDTPLFTKYINYIVIVYAFCVPISRAGIVLFSSLLFIFWLLEGNFQYKKEWIKNSKFLVVLFLFIFYSFVAILWADDKLHGIEYVIKYWYYLPILVIFTSLKKEYLNYSILAFLLGMLLSETLSYGIFFEWWTWKHGTPTDPTPFMNHLQYSMFLTFASLLLLNRLFFEPDWKWKIFYFLYFLVVTSNLFLNGGRTGHLAFAISIFVVIFLNIKNKIVAFFTSILLVVSIFYTAYQVSPVFKDRFDVSIQETKSINKDGAYCGSFGKRLGSWIVANEIIQDNPIFGVGMGDAMDSLKEYIIQNSHTDKECIRKDMVNYHNYYIHTTVQIGIIGLILYLLIFYYLYKTPIKDKKIYNLMIIFISVYCVASNVENMFHQQFSMAIFALFTGLFLAQYRIENEI